MSRAHLAIISHEATPYRHHLHTRIAAECNHASLHLLYTGSKGEESLPWQSAANQDRHDRYFKSGHKNLLRHPIVAKRLAVEICAYISAHSISVIVVNGYADAARLLIIRTAHRNGIRVLLRGDSNILGDSQRNTSSLIAKRSFLRQIDRYVDGYLAMGSLGRAFFSTFSGTAKPIFLCPVEPDYERWSLVNKAEQVAFAESLGWHRAGRRRFLCCSRLVDIKRIDLVIAAFLMVSALMPSWDLVVVGDGPERDRLAQLIPPEIKARVHWLGFRDGQELVTIFQLCDVLVHAADKDAWALVINEALAAGLAVICSDRVGACAELVKHHWNGIVVPKACSSFYADAMMLFLSQERLFKHQRNARLVLEEWRHAGDPVRGLNDALRYVLP